MKLTIECPPEVFEILSNHYDQITPIDERLDYTFDEFMTDILIEETTRIKHEYMQEKEEAKDNISRTETDSKGVKI